MDPIVIKAAVGIVTSAASKKDSHGWMFSIILGTVISLLLIISFVTYLLTSPLSVLATFLGDADLSLIEAFQNDYGYSQNIGVHDKDYETGSGQTYEGIIFGEEGEVQVVYYNQLDERWAGKPYGSSTVGRSGCGPTSMSIVISTLTNTSIDLPNMAVWAAENGYYCEGSGSYHSLIPETARHYGLTVEDDLTAQGIIDALAEEKLIVAIMSKGHFTKSGHFIVLRGITAEGKILVADPASVDRSSQAWDLSIILKEARKGAGAGGPFWAIGS